jgi:hypothetical protein
VGRFDRAGKVPEPVLAQLRDLDPCQRADRPAIRREPDPRGLGIAVAAQPPQESRALGEHPRLGPWRVAPARLGRVPGPGDRIAAWPAAEVRRASRRPPRLVVGARFADREPGALGREDEILAGWCSNRSSRRGERRFEAAQRLLVTPLAGEGAGEAGKVSRRRLAPALGVGVAAVDVDEESGERSDVLVVVANDVDKRAGLAEAEVVEEARRDLPAGDVGVAAEAEQLGLDRGQAGVAHPVPKDPPHQRQQVEVARVQRWVRARHPISGDEQRPVEPAPVVGHEPAVPRDVRGQLVEERRLVGMVR